MHSISNSSRTGATVMSQVYCKLRPFLVPPSDADNSRSNEPHRVFLQRRCPGLQVSSRSFAPGPQNIWVDQLSLLGARRAACPNQSRRRCNKISGKVGNCRRWWRTAQGSRSWRLKQLGSCQRMFGRSACSETMIVNLCVCRMTC